jgi:F0F1-type ATP synthase membrane subunit b/b'
MNAIELDLSVVIVMLLVWSLYLVLKNFFFDPINSILSERDQAINGARREAQEKLSQFDQKSQTYQQSIRAARLESYHQQESFRAEALKERAQIVAEGRSQSEGVINSAKQEIQLQVTTAKKTLENEVNAIADGIVKTILS